MPGFLWARQLLPFLSRLRVFVRVRGGAGAIEWPIRASKRKFKFPIVKTTLTIKKGSDKLVLCPCPIHLLSGHLKRDCVSNSFLLLLNADINCQIFRVLHRCF